MEFDGGKMARKNLISPITPLLLLLFSLFNYYQLGGEGGQELNHW
jgi:hypothetical protein